MPERIAVTSLPCRLLGDSMTAPFFALTLAFVLFAQADVSEGNAPLCMPDNPQDTSTSFLYFSRSNTHVPQFLRNSEDFKVNSTNYNCTKETKFIIHGYMSCSDMDWVQVMKDSFLVHMDYNVILVDWRNRAWDSNISRIVVSVRTVAQETATLIRKLLKETCTELKRIHVIGHSLGAHLAGFVGKEMFGTLPRITGLDPGAFYFQDASKDKRLDKTDAQFVDVIHTNAINDSYPRCVSSCGVGMSTAIGHLDFYPNGGSRQPGCPNTIDLVKCSTDYNETFGGFSEEEQVEIFCHHQRAPALFSATLGVSSQKLVAHSCGSYKSFLEGKCKSCIGRSSSCAVMGILADQYKPRKLGQGVKYFIKTFDKPPYF